MEAIRIVVVGCGMRAVWGIAAILKERRFQLVGLVDSIVSKAQLQAEHFGISGRVSVFANLHDCQRSLQYDAAAVFTPDGTHADVVIPELEAGHWVFVEKPLDVTADRLAAIIATDDAAGGRTFVGLNLRFAPLYRAIAGIIRQGVIGKLLTIQADEFYDGGRTYFRRWNRFRQFSGGLWITKSCHDFDLIYMLAGRSPRTVAARCALSHYLPRKDASDYCGDCGVRSSCADRHEPHPVPDSLIARLRDATAAATGQRTDLCLFNYDKDTFDHGSAIVEFEDGLIASYTVNVVAGFTNRRIRLSGTAATVDGDLTSNEIVIQYRDPSRVERIQLTDNASSHGGADEHVMAAFADFIGGDRSNAVTPAEAAVSVRIALAAQESCDTNSIVTVSSGIGTKRQASLAAVAV